MNLTLLKITTIIILLMVSLTSTKAQENALKLQHKVSANKSVEFVANKTDPGTYTLIINFKELSNTSAGQQQTLTVKNYSANVLTLTPVNRDQNIGFSYSYTYIRGKLNPKYDPAFVYLMPYPVGTQIKVAESGFVNARYFGSTTPEDWKAYRFYTDQPETITAARKGLVVNVKDLYNTDDLSDVAYTSKINEITIEHADGTLAFYRGFKQGIKVKVGETVFPGTPLGTNSKYSSNGSYNVSLMISYLKDKDFDESKGKTFKDAQSKYGFITPHFYTTENPDLIPVAQQSYTAATSTAIAQKELTKKEIKALGQ